MDNSCDPTSVAVLLGPWKLPHKHFDSRILKPVRIQAFSGLFLSESCNIPNNIRNFLSRNVVLVKGLVPVFFDNGDEGNCSLPSFSFTLSVWPTPEISIHGLEFPLVEVVVCKILFLNDHDQYLSFVE